MSPTRLLTLLLASLALVAAGCGGDDSDKSGNDQGAVPAETTDDPGSAAGSSGKGRAVEVAMKDIQFSPKDVTAKVGQTITWKNEDSVEHNVVAQDGGDFKSDLFGKDGTYSTTLKKAGKITYVCTVHPGMEGTITVTK